MLVSMSLHSRMLASPVQPCNATESSAGHCSTALARALQPDRLRLSRLADCTKAYRRLVQADRSREVSAGMLLAGDSTTRLRLGLHGSACEVKGVFELL